MGKIFCLMGKSSSGKDTVFKALLQDRELSLQPIIPYTTRPIRSSEKQGREYHFITDAELGRYGSMGKIIEQREYATVKGIWSYATVDDGQINLGQDNYLLIGTLAAYANLQRYFGAENIVPLYIGVDDRIRLERALGREKQQPNPNYDELCRRFLADNIDFSVENLQTYGIVKQYVNENLRECLMAVKADIGAAILKI